MKAHDFTSYTTKEIFLNTENKCHDLYWLDSDSGQRIPAGIAFFNSDEGDYNLKVDTFCYDKQIYLKPVSMEEGVINFRVESLEYLRSGAPLRNEIGTGHAIIRDGYPIYMDIGPFSRTLVLEAAV